MIFVTLAEIKEHLRIGGSAEDALLSTYATAAEDYASTWTGAAWVAPAPAAVKAAILLIIGDLYENREAQTPAALHVNKAVNRLLSAHRIF